MWHYITVFVDRFSLLLAYLAGASILCIALMQLLEIMLRNVFNISLPFVWEYASYLHMGAVFLAAGYTLRVGGHIRVTLLQKIHPRAFECMATTVALCISAFLSVALVKFAYNYGLSGRTSGTVNDVPLVYPAAFVAFGALMLTLQLFLRLVASIIGQPVELTDSTVNATQ
jgi:TRAP-type C4-dicarboxylate transport system permease small subunit